MYLYCVSVLLGGHLDSLECRSSLIYGVATYLYHLVGKCNFAKSKDCINLSDFSIQLPLLETYITEI